MDNANWKLRRFAVNITLVWVLVLCAYLLLYGEGESMLHDSLASNLLLLAFMTLGGYVFGTSTDRQVNDPTGAIGYRDYPDTEQESMSGKDTNLGKWTQRRKAIIRVMVLCALGIVYLAIAAEDSTLACTFASGLCLLYGGALNSWIFGAIHDDYAAQQSLRKM